MERIAGGRRGARAACVALLVAGFAIVGALHGRAVEPAAGEAPPGCTVQLASPLLVPLGSVPGGVVIDDACRYVYLTNSIENRIEVFSLQTLSLEEPIQVGAQPVGLDVTPDGALLYVADSGGNNLSVVSLARRVETRKVRVPGGWNINDRPYSIAIASNGRAVFGTTFNGSGFGGRLMDLNLATDQSVQRTDAPLSGTVDSRALVRASHDRSALVVATASRFYVYRAATGTFSPYAFVSLADIGVDSSGSRFLLVPGGFVYDSGMNQTGTIAGGSGSKGAAVDPGGVIAYRSMASKVEILNLSTYLKTGEIALGDSVTGYTSYASAGQMDLSPDGKLLAVTTTTGFVLVQR